MTIYGALRIKNESRWIERVIRAMLPLCDQIFVFDDHSDDGTVEICQSIERVNVFPSPFDDRDEARSKDWLLGKIIDAVPEEDQHFLNGNPNSPYTVLWLDGDEELTPESVDILRADIASNRAHAFHVRILYLWDRPDQYRVDGVYQRFADLGRPSVFRLMNRAFRFQRTPWGNGRNFHCSSIPQELLHHARPSQAAALHWGYLDKEDRLRKFAWYTERDANNENEGFYLHCVQGDIPEVPADARLKWAGPMRFEKVPCAPASTEQK